MSGRKVQIAAVLVAVLLLPILAFSGTIKVWSNGQTLTPADLNANFSHIHNTMVGGHGARLVDADVNASAAIATTKLAGAPNIAKAWAGMTTACTTGTCALADSSGISSITWTSTGNYTVNLSASRSGGYAVFLTAYGSTTEMCTVQSQGASSFTLSCHLTATGAAENSAFNVLVFDN